MRSEAHSNSHRTGELAEDRCVTEASGQVLGMTDFEAGRGTIGYIDLLQGSGWPPYNTNGAIEATEGL